MKPGEHYKFRKNRWVKVRKINWNNVNGAWFVFPMLAILLCAPCISAL